MAAGAGAPGGERRGPRLQGQGDIGAPEAPPGIQGHQ